MFGQWWADPAEPVEPVEPVFAVDPLPEVELVLEEMLLVSADGVELLVPLEPPDAACATAAPAMPLTVAIMASVRRMRGRIMRFLLWLVDRATHSTAGR